MTTKIQPKDGVLTVDAEVDPGSMAKVFQDEEDILLGMFTREDISIYFKNFHHMRTISDKIEVFLDNMYNNCIYTAQKERLTRVTENISDLVIISKYMKNEWPEYSERL